MLSDRKEELSGDLWAFEIEIPPPALLVGPRQRKRTASLGSAGAWGRRAERASCCCELSSEGDICLGAGPFVLIPPTFIA